MEIRNHPPERRIIMRLRSEDFAKPKSLASNFVEIADTYQRWAKQHWQETLHFPALAGDWGKIGIGSSISLALGFCYSLGPEIFTSLAITDQILLSVRLLPVVVFAMITGIIFVQIPNLINLWFAKFAKSLIGLIPIRLNTLQFLATNHTLIGLKRAWLRPTTTIMSVSLIPLVITVIGYLQVLIAENLVHFLGFFFALTWLIYAPVVLRFLRMDGWRRSKSYLRLRLVPSIFSLSFGLGGMFAALETQHELWSKWQQCEALLGIETKCSTLFLFNSTRWVTTKEKLYIFERGVQKPIYEAKFSDSPFFDALKAPLMDDGQ